ncbi:DUF5681 domain-containing protein [Bradyrhizobium barranii]|uniref:DUF5681 domain-containing protein n=1 Tax=Bradyrhizobium barranii TaxID=2992140 RepID=UPI0024AF6709|nr:DUF5681 domain-containing protein [Bradyrhizobium barranii]WFT92829.1 DUF5681 domain-containing protein [Bradyrhizobium barranii]
MRPINNANEVGYGRPPRGSRYVKAQSGNPAGRPRGRHRLAPFEAVLGQMVTIREGGAERLVTATEAYLLHLAKRGLDGDGAAARASMALIEKARGEKNLSEPMTIVLVSVDPGGVTLALEPLRMAKKLDPFRETARMAIEPWLVEAALKRLPQPLSPTEQRIVVDATRTPKKVRWPEWWSEYP